MFNKLHAPVDVVAEAKDNSVLLTWSEVEYADGYYLRLYKAAEPDKCIKKRNVSSTHKLILGLENGTEYYVTVSGYRYLKGSEQEGDSSEKISFVPISETLKAQRVICIDVDETAQLEWESGNQRPMVHFKSDNESVAKVGGGGIVRGIAEGVANITVSSLSEEFTTKVVVGRKQHKALNKAVVMLTGELMCSASQQIAGLRKMYDFSECFRNVRGQLESADLTVGMLQAACNDSVAYEHEQRTLETGSVNSNAPSGYLCALSDAGFDVISTAANRCSVKPLDSLNVTVDTIKRLGMDNLGTLAGGNPVYRRVRGIRIALIGCTMVFNNTEKQKFGLPDEQLGVYSRTYFEKLVKQSRKSGAEYIIAYMCWGKTNSHAVTKEQREEAQFMADCGADLIVGAHSHMMQEIAYITASDGRTVPCAYSLGNFISAQTEFAENRDSIMLRAELTRENDGISTALSYIPCYSADTDHGISVRTVYPVYSDDSREAYNSIRKCVGNAVEPFENKPFVALNGSVILQRIFNTGNKFKVDKTAVLLSQLSACTGTPVAADGVSGALKLDLEKSFAEYIRNCGAEYLAVDFYTSVRLASYKLGDNVYTGSQAFIDSDFYHAHESEFKRMKPSLTGKLWRPAVKRYAEAVKAVFPGERVILFRQYFSDRYAEGSELRNITHRDSINDIIKAMEEYFISLVQPSVVNLSGHYFSIGSSPSDYEQEYYVDAASAAERIIKEGRRCISVPDVGIWYDRVLKYYDSMTARAFQSWLLDMHSAADMLIAYTNLEFAAKHRARLISLKQMGESQLNEVSVFFSNDSGAKEIIAAAKIINAVLSGDLSQNYDFYSPAFRNRYNIVKIMAKLLSMEIEAPVSEASAERVFLLRNSPDKLKTYLRGLNNSVVDIWGSDISKEIIDRCKGIEIEKYIFKQCPITSYEALIPLEIPKDSKQFSGSSWRARSTADAFARSGMFALSKTSAKWLVIDLYECICEMNEYMGGLFEVDEFMQKTLFYKSIQSECTPCYLFEKRNMKYCHQALSRFAMDLSERYGKNIILIRSDLKDKYITLNDRLKPLEADSMLPLKRKFLGLCEDLFIQFTGCYVVDISKHYYASDRYPDGGADIAHYEDEFYRLSAEYISRIINGSTERVFDKVEQEYISLRDLRLERND